LPWGVESFMARPLIRLPVRVQRDAEHIGSNFPSSSLALRQGESIPALYAGLVPSHHVTGAAGAGIGQGVSWALAREGANVVVSDAHPTRPFQVADNIKSETGRETLGIVCDVTKEYFEDFEKSIPLGRSGKPSDIAGAVLFLVTDEESYMTGQTLSVSGGWTLY